MTNGDNAGLDPLIGEVIRTLDMAVVEWQLDQSYRPLSGTPRWFTGTVPWASLPFLQHFVDEARRFLHDHIGGVLASDQFSVQSSSEELLLRARALKIEGRLVVSIERLEGASDMRPVLRHARQQALDHEALTERARAIHMPLDAVARAVADLQRSPLSDDQRPLVEALSRSLTKLQEVAAPLPPPRKRR
jgi:hypothetical protein